jgi:hypothetical protein
MGLVGSWARFFVGLGLSAEVVRASLAGDGVTGIMVALSTVFLLLSAGWAVRKGLGI